jgi:hypothetical protein
MAARLLCVAVPLALLLGCGQATTEPAPAVTELSQLLPAPSSLEGWVLAEGPAEYLPETLYEYLDGIAPQYLSHGFRRLVHVRYESQDHPGASVTLDLFDMAGDLGAFGIYRSVRPPGVTPRSWGAEGHLSGLVAAAWKGNVFVHAEAGGERPAPTLMLERLVAEACARVPGEGTLPSILDPLPSEGLVPWSERYVSENLLGHACLPGGVLALYRRGESESQLFYSDVGNEAAAVEAMNELRAHHSRWGATVDEIPSPGAGGFRFSEPGLGPGTMVRTGRYVAGIHGDLPREERDRLLARLVGGLGSSVGGD